MRVRETLSEQIHVECGVPQGSVLGPRLFLVFINDVVSLITSNCLLYADDVKVWHPIKDSRDNKLLQEDLDRIYGWSILNHLQFNLGKCRVLHLRHPTSHIYKLGDHVLQHSFSEKDLGVVVQEDLGCSEQSAIASKKGVQNLGLLRRAFGRFDQSVFPKLLSAYIRPHTEYAIQAWHPWQKRDLTLLEIPQRRATKNVRGLYNVPYEQRLRALNVFSGRYRRLRGDLIMVYQMLTNPGHPCSHLLKLNQNSRLRGHHLKLAEQYSRLECRRNFFSLRVCHMWNNLPHFVVSAPTLTVFKQRVDRALAALHHCT